LNDSYPGSKAGGLYLALIHYPVKNRNNETIASAVTNLDIHDIARAARTYGVHAFYVVTPLEDQRILVSQILRHWETGAGSVYNRDRKEALSIVTVKSDMDEILGDIMAETGMEPLLVATTAADCRATLSFKDFRRGLAKEERPWLLLLGTGWGLADEIIESADFLLEPIRGKRGGEVAYNHLSVRSAASIILDRVLG